MYDKEKMIKGVQFAKNDMKWQEWMKKLCSIFTQSIIYVHKLVHSFPLKLIICVKFIWENYQIIPQNNECVSRLLFSPNNTFPNYM